MSFEKNLAKLVVQYSVRVKKGDLVCIKGPTLAEDLIREIFIEVLKGFIENLKHIRSKNSSILK